METATHSHEKTSILSLISNLREDLRNLVRQEVQLAKTELGEKARLLGRNGALLAIW